MIYTRTLYTSAEIEAIVDLEILIWGMPPRDAVPAALLTALAHHGGHVLGAYDDERLIGFSAAFLARDGDTLMLWSHMAAVHPEYQSQGIGFQIKQEQRAWALAHGYTRMGWTFDPLQPRNAKFNLHQLGAVCQRYHPDFYGTMQDALNAGAIPLPSDRLEVTWHLDAPHVEALAQGQPPVSRPSEMPFLLVRDAAHQPQVQTAGWDAPCYAVELPLDSAALRREDPTRLLVWQTHLRETLQAAFAHSYAATDFVIENGRGWYIVETSAL